MITEFSLLGDPSFLIHIFTEILKYFCYFFNLKGGRGFKKQRWKNMHKMRKKTLQKMRLIRKWEDLYRPSSKVNKSLLIRQFYLFNFLWEANAYSSCKMSQTVIPQNLIIFTIYITYNKIYLSIFKIIIQMYDLCIFFFLCILSYSILPGLRRAGRDVTLTIFSSVTVIFVSLSLRDRSRSTICIKNFTNM